MCTLTMKRYDRCAEGLGGGGDWGGGGNVMYTLPWNRTRNHICGSMSEKSREPFLKRSPSDCLFSSSFFLSFFFFFLTTELCKTVDLRCRNMPQRLLLTRHVQIGTMCHALCFLALWGDLFQSRLRPRVGKLHLETDDALAPQREWDASLLAGCLTSQQHASVSQGRICSDNCTCCHTEIEVAK